MEDIRATSQVRRKRSKRNAFHNQVLFCRFTKGNKALLTMRRVKRKPVHSLSRLHTYDDIVLGGQKDDQRGSTFSSTGSDQSRQQAHSASCGNSLLVMSGNDLHSLTTSPRLVNWLN